MECACLTIKDLDVVHMGGAVDADDKFRSDHVFATLTEILNFGSSKQWLYISECQNCLAIWLIAQDDRIYDDWYFARIDEMTLEAARHGTWPKEFDSFESVLMTGRMLSNPPIFIDSSSPALVDTVADLRGERAGITDREIAWLLGVSTAQAGRLRKIATLQSN